MWSAFGQKVCKPMPPNFYFHSQTLLLPLPVQHVLGGLNQLFVN